MPTGQYNVFELSTASTVSLTTTSAIALTTAYAIATTPSAANVATGAATNSAGTILTIPANRTWQGSITVTACLGSGSVAVNQTAQAVTPASTGASFPVPAGATLCQVVLNTPISTSTSAPTASVFACATTPNVVIMAGTSATTLALTAGAAIQSINGVAVGVLL